MRNSKIPIRLWLAALWHITAAADAINAAAFSRRYDLRHVTAWRLLTRVRDSLPHIRPSQPGAKGQLLGRHSPKNKAWVSVSLEDGELCAMDAAEAPPVSEPHATASLWLGQLRATIAYLYRGVKRRYLDGYLAEFAHRFCIRRLPPCEPRWWWEPDALQNMRPIVTRP